MSDDIRVTHPIDTERSSLVLSRTIRLRTTVIATMLAGLLVLAACSSDANDTNDAAAAADDTEMTTGTTASGSTDDAMSGEVAARTFGDACSAVPADGAGSFDGMAQDPVAT